MFNPFVNLLSNIISLLNLLLIVWLVLDLLIAFDILNRRSPLVQRVHASLGRFLEPLLRPIRRWTDRYFSAFRGIDLSPMLLLLALHFIEDAAYSWFYTM